jgi:uncharacterized protein YhfF
MTQTDEMKQYWADFATRHAEADPNEPFQSWHFGNTPDLADELFQLVLSGKKFGTSSLPWEFADQPELTPTVATFSVVTDFNRQPKAIVRTTRVRILPFNEVDAEHAFAEGEGDQSLDHWRGVHWDYFNRQCIEAARHPSETMPVICEEFELLHPLPINE